MPPTFATRIVTWQARHGRHDLPWQRSRDPYRIWLSEIMLQQTQVAAVIPYYTRFLEAFPDVAALAAAPLERVLEHWSGLGYYRRAHHLHAAAQEVMREHGGKFPSTVDALIALPGIGRSTAAAIAVFAADAPAAILDGNVKRVLARHDGIDGWPGLPKVEAALWQLAQQRLPAAASAIVPYTQGLMDLGATVCTRRAPRCDACPVAGDCVALREGRIDVLPAPKPRKPLPHKELRLLLLERAGEFLFEKRAPLGIWGGLWSLPECSLAADVEAELRARFGAEVDGPTPLPAVEHAFTHYTLTMHPSRLRVRRWPLQVATPGTLWLSPADAQGAALPAPIKTLLRSLLP